MLNQWNMVGKVVLCNSDPRMTDYFTEKPLFDEKNCFSATGNSVPPYPHRKEIKKR